MALRTSLLVLASLATASAFTASVPALASSRAVTHERSHLLRPQRQGIALPVQNGRPSRSLGGVRSMQAKLNPVQKVYTWFTSSTTSKLKKALLAESFGTFMIVLLGTGIMAASEYARAPVGGLFGVAFMWGMAVAGAAHAFANVSGGHFNPAISLAVGIKKGKEGTPLGWAPLSWVPAYMIAQLFGAILASSLVAFMFASHISSLGMNALPASMVFGCYPAVKYGLQRAIVAEVVGTTMIGIGFKLFPNAWNFGAWYAAITMLFAPFSGASFNPARELGPRLVQSVYGINTSKLITSAGINTAIIKTTPLTTHLLPYMAAPMLGALLGVYFGGYFKEVARW